MRSLLSVGCNAYLHATLLRGAEADAKRIFDALVGQEPHQYAPADSKLIFSPTTSEFRQALLGALDADHSTSVFTLYFAGHAAVSDETLYLAFKDTNPKHLPLTAIAFTELLRAVLGARPRQVNFVLDACNAGGLAFDLASILKRSIIGTPETAGVSFVAAAAAEEAAKETALGGAFTVQFAKFLDGSIYVQRSDPFLGLIEIAQKLKTTEAIPNQTVSSWGLNLQGPNLFAKNPFYSGPHSVTDSFVSRLQQSGLATAQQLNKLKSSLAHLTTRFDERELAEALEDALKRTPKEERAELLYALIEGLRPDLAKSDDAFLESRVYSVFLGQLIGLCEEKLADDLAKRIIAWLVEATTRALNNLQESENSTKYALIDEPISDLFYLPIRIADTLGSIGLLLLAAEDLDEQDMKLAHDSASHIIGVYGNSIVALSDDQACGFLIFLEACRRLGWRDWAEEIVGRLFYDLDLNFGRVAGNTLSAQNQVRALEERYEQIEIPDRDIYCSPSDLATVILTYLALLKLDEAVDYDLIRLDHMNLNFLLPDDLTKFGLVEGIVGTNLSMALGHDFWRLVDIRRILNGDVFPIFAEKQANLPQSIKIAVLAASLALRDRMPWNLPAEYSETDIDKIPIG